jgi:hypothetical protein
VRITKENMHGGRAGRGLAAGVVLLYALVAALLGPIHLLLEGDGGAGREGPPAAAVLACGGGDCGDPAHHHSGAPAHDDAKCAACAQARAAAAPGTSGPAPIASLLRAGAGPESAALPSGALPRVRPPARGPPSSS